VRPAWLFGARLDVSVFLGSFALSMIALAAGAWTGMLDDDTPSWLWVPAVILCDVAHVWATAFRTYLDPGERRARRRLFTVVPVVGLAASIALYALGTMTFWRTLAYLAIFHFVRQQYGWVSLYRARNGERARLGKVIDTAAIYASTLYPLLYWHTHVPRRFSWFVTGDVVALPPFLLPAGFALWALALAAYVVRAIVLWSRGTPNPGKDLVVATTAVAWYLGIVAFDSDYAFTVTNVFMHGIPYFALVFVQGRRKDAAPAGAPSWTSRVASNVFAYLGVLWVVAFVEELLWDRAVWHDRAWLFGEGWSLTGWELVIVPLLALPQLTHYVLDGFIWKRRSNQALAALASAPSSAGLDVDPRGAEA
jgi:hypothetical protein